MAKEQKKQLRAQFLNLCFLRDSGTCRGCGEIRSDLEAHHITSRDLMPAGGYVKENGICLCGPCHHVAELGFWTPEELYEMIGSSYEKAYEASLRLEAARRK